jgi:hypothetical protein
LVHNIKHIIEGVDVKPAAAVEVISVFAVLFTALAAMYRQHVPAVKCGTCKDTLGHE